MTSIRLLGICSMISIYGMIVLGALIRTTNSGLSCPDWPTCYGYWIFTPAIFESLGPIGYSYAQVMYEWVHRALAAVVIGPLLLLLAIVCWRKGPIDPVLPRLAGILMVLLLIQGALGGITVFDANSPWSVALHLGTALLLLTTATGIVRRADTRPTYTSSALVAVLAVMTWTSTLATMLTAAMTAKSGASLACSTWPLCDGAIIPDVSDPLVAIHFAHRTLALVTALLLLTLYLATRYGGSRARHAWPFVAFACVTIFVQISIGALVILLEVPVWAGILHQAVAVLIFVSMTWLMWSCLFSPQTMTATIEDEPEHERLRYA